MCRSAGQRGGCLKISSARPPAGRRAGNRHYHRGTTTTGGRPRPGRERPARRAPRPHDAELRRTSRPGGVARPNHRRPVSRFSPSLPRSDATLPGQPASSRSARRRAWTTEVGGGRGQVDHHVDGRGVPALAEQRPGADQAARAALGVKPGDQRDVAPRLPRLDAERPDPAVLRQPRRAGLTALRLERRGHRPDRPLVPAAGLSR
jgi:hypothetical protein